MKLAPHNWVLDPNTPHELSGNLKLQDPTMETIVRYIHDDYLPPLEEWQKQRGKNAS